MGRSKEELERQYEQKYSNIEDRQVCSHCFCDRELKDFILSESDGIGCDYCNDSNASKRKSRNVNTVIEHISNSIHKYYEDPIQQITHDSSEGGYLWPTIDTYDLLEELIEVKNPNLLTDIQRAFEITQWCKRNPYSTEINEEMFQDWSTFCENIKHKKRFFLNKNIDIFDSIVLNLKEQNLFRIIKPIIKFFRARTFHSSTPFPLQFSEITIPPKEVLIKQSNRMSAAGIPLFYCSDSAETAKAEAKNSNTNGELHDFTAFASFSNKKPLYILDLSKLPRVPSIFGAMEFIKRENLIFLKMFRNDIMKTVARDGREHVEYIPSQIFTEYIRYHMKNGKQSINGICYPSNKSKNGLNYALFLSSKQIAESNDSSGKIYIYYNLDITSENQN